MGGDSASNLDSRHLPTDDQDLPTIGPPFSKQALQVTVCAAVKDRYVAWPLQCFRDDGLSKEAGSNEDVVEYPTLFTFPIGLHNHIPSLGPSIAGCRIHNPGPQLDLKARLPRQIAAHVVTQIPSHHPCQGKLWAAILPRVVAEMHRVLALVGHHHRVDLAVPVRAGSRP